MCKVSFLIPAYNAEWTIERCLDSILNSSLEKDKYEIIVWNDGSIDHTEEIVKRYASKYNNILLITKPNQGVAEVRKSLFAMANGEYIWQCDSDDYVETQNVVRLINYAEKHNLDVLYFDYKQLGEHNYQKPRTVLFCHDLYVSYLWNKLYKRDFIVKNHIDFEGDLYTGDDVVFNCKVSSCSPRKRHISLIGYNYVYNPQSLTHNPARGLRDINSMIHCLDYFLKYRKHYRNYRYWDCFIIKNLINIIIWKEFFETADKIVLDSTIHQKEQLISEISSFRISWVLRNIKKATKISRTIDLVSNKIRHGYCKIRYWNYYDL